MTDAAASPERSSRLDDWRRHWSWSQMLRILSQGEGHEASRFVTRSLLIRQADCFENLLKEIDDPAHPAVSWEQPILETFTEFPFEWDTEKSLQDLEPETPGRDLFIALTVLTAGAAIQPVEPGASGFLLPRPIQRHLRQFPVEEARTCIRSWTTEKADYVSYGDRLSTRSVERTVHGKGRKGGEFRASLVFSISPRIFDPSTRQSGFHAVAHLPWEVTGSLPHPQEWGKEDRAALRRTISRFLSTLRDCVDQGRDAPDRVEVKVRRGGATEIEAFEAFSVSPEGTHYLEKVSPKPITKTVWRRFPAYALGVEGPAFDITNGHGELLALASCTVRATMLYPDDEQRRREFVAMRHTRLVNEVGKSLEHRGYSAEEIEREWPSIVSRAATRHGLLNRAVLQALEFSSSHGEIEARTEESRQRGILVGQMLLLLITCGRHHPEHVSVHKAAYLIRRAVKAGNINAGSLPGSSISFLLREWKRYKPVAHLWAAACRRSEESDLSGPATITIGRKFLAEAEAFRHVGEQCFGRAQRLKHGPVLDPTVTWRVPDDLELPKVQPIIEPLAEWSLACLGEYRAAARSSVSGW